jgi:uridine kinase
LPKKPFVIGIAGGSCSGKTVIAGSLAQALRPQVGVFILALDSYYNDFSGVPDDQIEVDVPGALDKKCLVEQLRALAAGCSVEKPVYDYLTHSRAPHGEWVEPGDCIIVEGLFALYWPEVRKLLNLSVFVAVDDNTALSRRIARDVRERGRTEQSVRKQYNEKVRPMYKLYVGPTREHADVVINGLDPIESSVEQICAFTHWKI